MRALLMKSNKKIWLLLPMRCLLFIFAFSFCCVITQKNLTEISHWWTIIASVINIVTIAVLCSICKHNGTTYCEMIRCQKGKRNIFKGFLFIAVMLMTGIGGMYLAGWLCYGRLPYFAPMMIAPIPPYLAILNIFILPVTTAIAEDGIYLGYGVNSFKSKPAAVLIPAFFYALQHSFIPTIFDMKFITYRFLSFLPLTIWICFQYHKRNSISYIMAGHWVLNMATTVQIVITSFKPEFYNMMIKQ